MVEAVAETSEELMEKFFMGEQLTREEIQDGLRKSVLASDLIPVLVGSAIKGIGIHTLLDMMIDYLPNPQDLNPIEGVDMNGNPVERKTLDDEPFSAFVFKTMVDPYFGTANVFKVNSGKIKVGDTVHVSKLDKDIQVSQLNVVTGAKMASVSELTAENKVNRRIFHLIILLNQTLSNTFLNLFLFGMNDLDYVRKIYDLVEKTPVFRID